MYRCQICGRAVGPRTPALRVVLETKAFQHPYRPKTKKVWMYKHGKWKRDWEPDRGGKGVAIVREATCCPTCAARN
jgi:hypothetical protein